MERRPSLPTLDDSDLIRSLGQPETLVRQRSHSYSDGVLPKRICVVSGCLENTYGRGYCANHFQMYLLTKPDVDVAMEISRSSAESSNKSYAVDGIHDEEVSSDNNLDPQDSHVVDKDLKVKLSTRMHVKKFWASRLSKFATARHILGQDDYVGVAGSTVLSVLKQITQATVGKTIAKSHREILLKTIAKWKVLVDGKAIVLSPPFLEQLASFGSCMTETLDRIVLYQNKVPGGESDLTARRALLRLDMFSEACRSFFDTVVSMLSPYMTSKNIIALKACLEYYGGVEFLLIFSEPRWREEQRMLREGTGTMLKDHIAPPCSRDKCYRPQLLPCGPFKGSKFCTTHHLEILHSPPLWFFLPSASGTGLPSFREFCSVPSDANKFFLQREIASYRAARRRVIRLQQVRFIFATFLFKNAPRRVMFEDHILGPVQVAVLQPGFYPSPILFRPLEHVLSEEIKAIFRRFQASPVYRKAVPEFTVPYCIYSRYSLDLDREEQELSQRKVKFSEHAEPLVLHGRTYESDDEAEKRRDEEALQKHQEQQRKARAWRKAERQKRRLVGMPISPESEEEDREDDEQDGRKSLSPGGVSPGGKKGGEPAMMNRDKEEREERTQTELLQREFAANMVPVQSAEDLKTMILAAEAGRVGGGAAPSGSPYANAEVSGRRNSVASKSALRSQSLSRNASTNEPRESRDNGNENGMSSSSSRSSGWSASSLQLVTHLATPGRGSKGDPLLQRSVSEATNPSKKPVSPSPTDTFTKPSSLPSSASSSSPTSPQVSAPTTPRQASAPKHKGLLGGLGFVSPHTKQKSEEVSPKSAGSSPNSTLVGPAQPSPMLLAKKPEPRARGMSALLRHFHRGSGSGSGSGSNSANGSGNGSGNGHRQSGSESNNDDRDATESDPSNTNKDSKRKLSAKSRSAGTIIISPPSPSPSPSPPSAPASISSQPSSSSTSSFGKSILGSLTNSRKCSSAKNTKPKTSANNASGSTNGFSTAPVSRNPSGEIHSADESASVSESNLLLEKNNSLSTSNNNQSNDHSDVHRQSTSISSSRPSNSDASSRPSSSSSSGGNSSKYSTSSTNTQNNSISNNNAHNTSTLTTIPKSTTTTTTTTTTVVSFVTSPTTSTRPKSIGGSSPSVPTTSSTSNSTKPQPQKTALGTKTATRPAPLNTGTSPQSKQSESTRGKPSFTTTLAMPKSQPQSLLSPLSATSAHSSTSSSNMSSPAHPNSNLPASNIDSDVQHPANANPNPNPHPPVSAINTNTNPNPSSPKSNPQPEPKPQSRTGASPKTHKRKPSNLKRVTTKPTTNPTKPVPSLAKPKTTRASTAPDTATGASTSGAPTVVAPKPKKSGASGVTSTGNASANANAKSSVMRTKSQSPQSDREERERNAHK